MAQKKWVYTFDEVALAEEYVGGSWEGVRSLLGGKGSGLADMTRAGVPVPPGFTVTTEACNEFRKTGKFPAGCGIRAGSTEGYRRQRLARNLAIQTIPCWSPAARAQSSPCLA